MSSLYWIIPIALAAFLGCVYVFNRWFVHGPGGNPIYAMGWWGGSLLVRVFHHIEWVGLDKYRKKLESGPLLVVSNHTAGIDPVLITAAFKTKIRWMMAADYMTSTFMWFWNGIGIIPVARDGKDSGPAREAIRYLKEGGIVGVFPEGGIVRPPREIRPFIPGIGLIVARSKAPVLLVWVSNTPATDSAFGSLVMRSNSRVEFLELIDFSNEKDAVKITEILRRKISAASGWPINNEPLPSARVVEKDPFTA